MMVVTVRTRQRRWRPHRAFLSVKTNISIKPLVWLGVGE
ncbi:unnamed protein product, partial [Larinioides sclopetarius]